jgi:hypothetical protein
MRNVLQSSVPIPLGHPLHIPNPTGDPDWISYPSGVAYEPIFWRPAPPGNYRAVSKVLTQVFKYSDENVEPEMFNEMHRRTIQHVYYRMYLNDLQVWEIPKDWWKRKNWFDVAQKCLMELRWWEEWVQYKWRDWAWFRNPLKVR